MNELNRSRLDFVSRIFLTKAVIHHLSHVKLHGRSKNCETLWEHCYKERYHVYMKMLFSNEQLQLNRLMLDF